MQTTSIPRNIGAQSMSAMNATDIAHLLINAVRECDLCGRTRESNMIDSFARFIFTSSVRSSVSFAPSSASFCHLHEQHNTRHVRNCHFQLIRNGMHCIRRVVVRRWRWRCEIAVDIDEFRVIDVVVAVATADTVVVVDTVLVVVVVVLLLCAQMHRCAAIVIR